MFWPSGGADLSPDSQKWRQRGLEENREDVRWMPATLDPA